MNELLFPNLVLAFPKGLGTFIQDENGNPIEEIELFNVYASVKRSSNPVYYQMSGIGQSDIVLKGKIVVQDNAGGWMAGSLPDFVNLESQADGALTFGEHVYTGRFIFLPTVQSRFEELYLTLGQRICGYLRVNARN